MFCGIAVSAFGWVGLIGVIFAKFLGDDMGDITPCLTHASINPISIAACLRIHVDKAQSVFWDAVGGGGCGRWIVVMGTAVDDEADATAGKAAASVDKDRNTANVIYMATSTCSHITKTT